MLFGHVCVVVITAIFAFSEFPKSKGGWARNIFIIFISCLGMYVGFFGLGMFRDVWLEEESSLLLRSWVISSIGLFVCGPMIVIETLSLFDFPSAISVVSLWLNWVFLASVFLDYIINFFLDRKRDIIKVELDEEVRYFPMNDEEEDVDDGEEGRKYVSLIGRSISPFFYFSFFPQILSLLGIPFALLCFKRFRTSLKKEPEMEGNNQRADLDMNRTERKGMFLIPLNALSFLFLMLVILPPITIISALFWIISPIRKINAKPVFNQVTSSFNHVVALLLFSYFPFLSRVPLVNEAGEDKVIRNWKKVAAFFWFLIVRLGLPVSDLVTDLLFSFELLRLFGDPVLDRREDLFRWMVVSFLASGVGASLWITRVAFMSFSLVQGKKLSFNSLAEFVIERSPFGMKKMRIESQLEGLAVIFEDMIQIVVAANTLRFIGKVDGLWGFKMGISIFSSCFSLGELLARFLFKPKRSKKLQAIVRFSFFAFFVMAISLTVGLTTGRDFCSLSRTVKNHDILRVFGECDLVGDTIVIQDLDHTVNEEFKLSEINGTMTLENVREPISLTSGELEELKGTLSVLGNEGELGLAFSKLNILKPGSSLRVESNSDILQVSMGFLTEIAGGSSLNFSSNTIRSKINLQSIQIINGAVTFSENQIEVIELDSLLGLDGNLTVLRNQVQLLKIPTLTSILGELKIAENPLLRSITFPSLASINGRLIVIENQQIESMDLSKLDLGASFTISKNQNLHQISIGNFTDLSGPSLFSRNPSLTHIVFPFNFARNGVGLEVSENESLIFVGFPRLDCRYSSPVTLLNNLNLEVVKIPSFNCRQFFLFEGNPKMKFEYYSDV